MYIHQRREWPEFTWDHAAIAELLGETRLRQGELLGRMKAVGFEGRELATLQNLTQEVMKSSEIEGEKLNGEQVRSSIARRLGIDAGGMGRIDRNVEGVVEVMLDATRNYTKPLTKKRLFGWHTALFPTGRSGMDRIVVGGWRGASSDPMQVISGAFGRKKVHFEAPQHSRLEAETKLFLAWFEATRRTDPVLKAALAHFWFVTIHPFEDGNGRISRAIADMMLARSEKSTQRFYSMSAQIQNERKTYYDVLEQCQKGSLDITPWLDWFLNCLQRAMAASDTTLDAVLCKARFWEVNANQEFNERQRLVLNRLLDGIEGNLTSSKWGKMAKCSQDSALRDLNDLVERGILMKATAGGRSTSYELAAKR